MTLGKSFRQSLRWSAVSAVFVSGLNFAQLLLLARLLDKADFGLIAIGQVFLQICLQIQNSVVNNAILHKQVKAITELSALYWVNLAIGLFFGLALWCLAVPVQWYYDDPELLKVVRWLAIIPLTEGLSNTLKVVWQKELAFRKIGSIEMIAALLSVAVSIILAFHGLGWKALAAGVLVKYGVEAFLYLLWQPPFIPVFTFNMREPGFFFRSGAIQSAERLVTLLGSQLDTLIIGKLLGVETLGLYDVLKKLLVRPSSLLNNLIERVTLPLFARLQTRPAYLKKIFLKVVGRLAALNLAGYGFLALFASLFLGLVLGEAWLHYVVEVRLICAFVLIHAILNPLDSLLVALGKVEKWLIANLVFFPFLATGLWIGCHFQLVGALMVMTGAHLIFLSGVWKYIIQPLLK
ncbi:MAG: oligosaccharide flippase family protein [Saprospiraceae bacterium]